jgi:AcrR family transcriptional regulator
MDRVDNAPTLERGIQPRRQPVQARSRERVERILDAAGQLLAEDGYDAVKTNAIAKRAGVSIGSVYQFFPNRFAIFNALAERYRAKISLSLEQYLTPETVDTWEEAIEQTIDSLAELWRTDWAFHSVWLAIQNTAELRESSEHYREALLNSPLTGYLSRIVPGATRSQVRTMGRVILESTNLLLDFSMRAGPEQDDALIDELKFLLHRYIKGHVDAATKNRV